MNKKVALVTGASRGIGRAIADALAEQGFVVAGTATSEAGAEAIGERLRGAGAEGAGFVMDVRDTASVEAALAAIEERLGTVLVLVNNAGITRDNIMLRMKEEEWEDVVNTNLNALFRVTRPLLKGMTRARWGRIINIGSVAALMGNPGQANYAAAKGGVEGFTRALAREVGSRNITVNSVAPGFIATDMTEDIAPNHRELLMSQIPLGRLGDPAEVASAVTWLASDGASYVTGTTINVNGGMFMG